MPSDPHTDESGPPQDLAAERHTATIATLNACSAVAMALLSGLALFGTLGGESQTEKSFYFLSASAFFLLGVINVYIWRLLPRRDPVARLMQLGVGAFALFGPPLGTLWGAYVLWALLRPRGRALFARPTPPDLPSPAQPSLATRPAPIRARPYPALVGLITALGLIFATSGVFLAQRELQLLRTLEERSAREMEILVDDAIEALWGWGEEAGEEGAAEAWEGAEGDAPWEELEQALQDAE